MDPQEVEVVAVHEALAHPASVQQMNLTARVMMQ